MGIIQLAEDLLVAGAGYRWRVKQIGEPIRQIQTLRYSRHSEQLLSGYYCCFIGSFEEGYHVQLSVPCSCENSNL